MEILKPTMTTVDKGCKLQLEIGYFGLFDLAAAIMRLKDLGVRAFELTLNEGAEVIELDKRFDDRKAVNSFLDRVEEIAKEEI